MWIDTFFFKWILMFTAADCYKLVAVESSIIWSFGVTRAFNCQFIAGWLNYNRVRFYHIFTYLHLQWTLWYQSAIKLSIFIQLRSNVVSVMINISDGIWTRCFCPFFQRKTPVSLWRRVSTLNDWTVPCSGG